MFDRRIRRGKAVTREPGQAVCNVVGPGSLSG